MCPPGHKEWQSAPRTGRHESRQMSDMSQHGLATASPHGATTEAWDRPSSGSRPSRRVLVACSPALPFHSTQLGPLLSWLPHWPHLPSGSTPAHQVPLRAASSPAGLEQHKGTRQRQLPGRECSQHGNQRGMAGTPKNLWMDCFWQNCPSSFGQLEPSRNS